MRRIAALLPLILTTLVLSEFHANGKIISGGQKYKSRNHIFTVVLPQPTAFEPMPYSVHEDAKKGEYATAAFFICDFGHQSHSRQRLGEWIGGRFRNSGTYYEFKSNPRKALL